MTELKAVATITAYNLRHEQKLVKQLAGISGVEHIKSEPEGSTFKVTAEAPCNPPFTCGDTIFADNGIQGHYVRKCAGCNRG